VNVIIPELMTNKDMKGMYVIIKINVEVFSHQHNSTHIQKPSMFY